MNISLQYKRTEKKIVDVQRFQYKIYEKSVQKKKSLYIVIIVLFYSYIYVLGAKFANQYKFRVTRLDTRLQLRIVSRLDGEERLWQ